MKNSLIQKHRRSLLTACALILAQSFAAHAASDRAHAGWVEAVRLLPGNIRVKAKLDTGAKTSSLHATAIEIFKRDKQNWVRFTVELEDTAGRAHKKVLERKRVRKVLIKEHEGEYDRRPVVEMEFCLGGQVHREQFTLADRSRFVYPVLLGRRFLRDSVLVDAGNTFLLSSECRPAGQQP